MFSQKPGFNQKAEPLGLQPTSEKLSLSQDEGDLKTYLNKIYSSYRQGQWAQVISQCERVAAHCRQKIAKEAERNQQNDRQQIASANPADSRPAPKSNLEAELYLAKGDLFNQQGNPAHAIQAYEQALALQPERSELLQKIGDLYTQQTQQVKANGNVAEAVRIYLRALEKHPRLFAAYNRLRYNLMRYDIAAGDPILSEIAASCQKIIEQHPTLLPAQITLAFALTKLGQKEVAIATYRRASELFTRRQLETQLQQAAQTPDKTSARSGAEISFAARQHKPDFMIIGAEKSGTTSLHQYLRQHPDVLSSVEKEIDFFDMEYEQGIDWYLAHFPPVVEPTTLHNKQKWLTGETSANYLYSDVAPQRVHRHFPNIKLAVILRNPVDRTISRYSMMVRNGAEQRPLEVAITEEIALIESAMARSADAQTIPWPVFNRCRHIGNSLYFYHLSRWLSVFPKEQLLVLKSEDLFMRPAQTLAQLYHRLGLSPHAIEDYPKHNAGQYDPAQESIRQQLSEFFAPHTAKLEALLGCSFDWES